MISVDEARSFILDGVKTLDVESIALDECAGRIAGVDVLARMTQPPFAASAMDGYAVRFADAQTGATLRVIGEAPAGAPFDGAVGEGEAVRIFTGGVVPAGADHVVIQEDVARSGETIAIIDAQNAPRHIRLAGIDFHEGDVLAQRGAVLNEVHGALFAAANIARVDVIRRPRVAIFSNGDELVEPGGALKAGQIVNSNHYALSALVKSWGGEATYLGCASDSEDAIAAMFEKARNADIIVPVGGASVGDYDFVKSAFRKCGGEILFEKVAVRPGKPTWFGRIGPARIVGLPGNPASAIVTATLFVRPLIAALGGADPKALESTAPLSAPLPANGPRESYLRAVYDGEEIAPAPNQDSSLLRPFADANALIRRPPNGPALAAGDAAPFLRLR